MSSIIKTNMCTLKDGKMFN